MVCCAEMQSCVLVNGSCGVIPAPRTRSIARPAVSWTHLMDWALVLVTGFGVGIAGVVKVMAAIR
jgi:hypothetical protein